MINKFLNCSLSCEDTNKDFIFPKADINADLIKLIMISESPPQDHNDYFYKDPKGSFFRTTELAFNDAGFNIENITDLTKLGVYLTTAIKCSKKDYLVSSKTIKECSKILENEIFQFTNVKIIMCMGNFAIKAINYITKRKYKTNIIPSGSTYKIRKEVYELNGIRYFPSYTQTGESFNIEKSKRKMISEDIKSAMSLL